MLEKVVEGTALVALATTEPTSGDNWRDVSTTAEKDGADWVLRGEKVVVAGAPLAGYLLVTARTSGDRDDEEGISLFLVDLSAVRSGLTTHPYRTIDDAARRTSRSTGCGYR